MLENKILAIDATWLSRRQFHATKKSTNSEGVQDPLITVNSVRTCIGKKIRDLDYQYTPVALWDRGTYRYRPKEQFTNYKESRSYDDSYQACWDACNYLVPFLRDIGVYSVQIGGLEADDLGYYFSHKYDDVILWTTDSDWRQSITGNTVIHKNNEIISLQTLAAEGIEDPRDLAIHKAVEGGHDDIEPVRVEGLKIKDIIAAYKDNTLPEEAADKITHNMKLTRLDNIITDAEAISMIQDQLIINPPKSFSEYEDIMDSINAPNHIRTTFRNYLDRNEPKRENKAAEMTSMNISELMSLFGRK